MGTKKTLKLYEEAPDLEEVERVTEALIPLLRKLIEQGFLTGTTYRDTHAKGHLAVRAEFEVPDDLDEDLRVGLFAQPATYQAWARFSNLDRTPAADIKKDIRAVSFKLMGVPGERLWRGPGPDGDGSDNLDLLMMGSPTFLSRNPTQFLALEEAILKGGIHTLWFFLTNPGIVRTIATGQAKCANLLEIPYWSQTAYAFGDRAVQYHLRPRLPATSELPKHPTDNFLRRRLLHQLADGEQTPVEFDFMVQFQTDPVKMPIEDPMVRWQPSQSPYRKVATIRFPLQHGDSPEQRDFCENLSFNPWRTLPEHRPLGGINRVRLKVYPAIAEYRHTRNGVEPFEPTVETRFPDEAFSPPLPDGTIPSHESESPMSEKQGIQWWKALLLAALLAVVIIGGTALKNFLYPDLPAPVVVYDVVEANENWTRAERQWFHHTSQGSRLMPVDWYVALEQVCPPLESWFGMRACGLISDPEFLSQYRLLPDVDPLYNEYMLPTGFAIDDPRPGAKKRQVGVTCAACHTSQLNYKGMGYRIDGGAGMLDVDGYLQAIAASAGVTLEVSKKFDRFACRVLGDGCNNKSKKDKLRKEFKEWVTSQLKATIWTQHNIKKTGQKNTTSGFGRIDALGQGGNTVYGKLDGKNLAALNAPVNVLPLWYAHSYGWVQTNSSIRQPMGRNIIESLAVNSYLSLPGTEQNRYESSSRLENMFQMESLTTKLKAPKWPETLFGELDADRVAAGKELYREMCANCHAPKLESEVVAEKDYGYTDGWSWPEDCPQPTDEVSERNGQDFFFLRMYDVDDIGTDPHDAVNFATRQVYGADKIGIGKPGKAVSGAAKVIPAVIDGIMARYYKERGIDQKTQEKWNGYRGSLWRACEAYPARPLAGVWSTAPFLHNGSVPNLYQLLSPVAERDKSFYVGNLEFDPEYVGYETERIKGAFEVDTSITGNANTGHEFRDAPLGDGVVGRALSEDERLDLIEYLKSLSFEEEMQVLDVTGGSKRVYPPNKPSDWSDDFLCQGDWEQYCKKHGLPKKKDTAKADSDGGQYKGAVQPDGAGEAVAESAAEN